MEQKTLTELTDQELQQKLKKRKQSQIFAALFIGVSIGVAVWRATHKGGLLFTLLPFLVAYFFRKKPNELQEVQKEIESRKVL